MMGFGFLRKELVLGMEVRSDVRKKNSEQLDKQIIM